MFEILREDFTRYHRAGGPFEPRPSPLRASLNYGFLAVCVYRYGRWCRALQPRWLAFPFKALYLLLKIPVELLLGIYVSTNSDIGPGLYIGHFGGIFLVCNAGRNLSVGQQVTIGYKGAGKSDRWPELGNDVYVGAGAKVIGDIRIGDGVVIGANTVVTRDVPAYTRVVGAKVRVSPIHGPAAPARDASPMASASPEDETRL